MKSRLSRFRDNHSSLIISLIGTGLYLLLFHEKAMPSSLDNLFLGGITVSAGLAGFLITSMSIILSLEEKYIIKQLRRTNLYDKLIECFVNAVRWHFASLLLGLIGLFLEFKPCQHWHNYFFAGWIFFLLQALCTSYRVIDVLQKTATAQKN